MITLAWWLISEFARRRAIRKQDPQILASVIQAWRHERYDLNPALRKRTRIAVVR